MQCLVKYLSDEIDLGTYQHDCHPMMVRQNKWRATRFGVRAQIVDSYTYKSVPVEGVVETLASKLAPTAEQLECDAYLERCCEIAAGPSWADRQRDIMESSADPTEIVQRLTTASRLAPQTGAHSS